MNVPASSPSRLLSTRELCRWFYGSATPPLRLKTKRHMGALYAHRDHAGYEEPYPPPDVELESERRWELGLLLLERYEALVAAECCWTECLDGLTTEIVYLFGALTNVCRRRCFASIIERPRRWGGARIPGQAREVACRRR